jgi:flagellar motor switch/type III secretory pathway protein FliN
MEPVLTQEELEAIYAAMKGDDLPSMSVDDVSLTSGQAFVVRAESKWNEAVKAMCGTIESILMGALGRRVTVRLQPSEAWLDSDEQPEADVIPVKDARSVLATGKIGAVHAIYAVDLDLARKVVERRTGAVASDETDAERTELTPLETRLLKDLIRDLVQATAKVAPKKDEGIVTAIDPEDVWLSRNRKETWIIGSLGVAEFGGRGVRFIAPSSLFVPKPLNARDVIAKHLQNAAITLTAELGTFRLSVARLWHMKPGTVIPMGATVGDPLKISIGGVGKLLGEPLVSRGNVAVRVVGRIENGVS